MRDDFEISTPEIYGLVESACAFGALGARLTGGGFGGCIIACIPADLMVRWKNRLLSSHPHAEIRLLTACCERMNFLDIEVLK